MIASDDYEPMDYQPRVALKLPLRLIAGVSGYDILRWLFDHPDRGYIISDLPHHEYQAELLSKLSLAGLVAPSHNGYQLTADGRFYYHREHSEFMARIDRQARHDREVMNHYLYYGLEDDGEDRGFDLLDF